MIEISSLALATFLNKNNINYQGLNVEKIYFFTLEDRLRNVVNINSECNIIVIGKYQFLNNEIAPIIKFTLFKHGSLLIPLSLYANKKELTSAIIKDNHVKIVSTKRHAELIFLLSKHLDKYQKSEFFMTENIVQQHTTNIM